MNVVDDKNELVRDNEKLMALALWVGSIISWFIIPVIIYLLNSDSWFIKSHLKAYINKTLSYTLYTIVLSCIVLVLGVFTFGFGWVLFSVVALVPSVGIVVAVLGMMDALSGNVRNYPTCIEFMKVK